MTFYTDNETDFQFEFEWEDVFQSVALAVLDSEACPYETQVSLVLTDNEGIHAINKETRDIDRPTDVLSFPNITYQEEGKFDHLEEFGFDCFDPDTGELILGDIIISVDKVIEQAEEYGHSQKREGAYLCIHGVLHLLGYDHIEEEDKKEMRLKEEELLTALKITRED